jgi:hypothetical protein
MDSRHTLVIVLIIAVIGIGFYDFASPFEKCKRVYLENKSLYDVRDQVNWNIGKCENRAVGNQITLPTPNASPITSKCEVRLV